ncbi:protein of unknown function [Candidatus Filomicrobium marinum]|uniref:Uncharacterized protein n=1 Tax=Candidatus Filomicrobium marinum TaxID=1608628 RepID=A0A0D6J9R6_9HYPH|nr:protein of unknown function [Candidatus Filomicrobium marinum]CPR15117.1 protein of unknown function [Candidatus Filomicrobium marinum]
MQGQLSLLCAGIFFRRFKAVFAVLHLHFVLSRAKDASSSEATFGQGKYIGCPEQTA